MKSKGGILTFLTIILSSLVSAGPVEGVEQVTRGAREIIIIIIEFISNIFFDLDSFDEFLFAKLLILLIIFFITYTVIKQNKLFSSDKNINIIIASAISILSVRYLPSNFVQAILMQYNVFAVAATTFLPFFIFFFFLHKSQIGTFGRRAGWVLYGASFIAMWTFIHEDIGIANYIYWVGIAFVIISLLFDKTIHTYFGISSIKKIMNDTKIERRVAAQTKLETVKTNRNFYSDVEYKRIKEKWEKIVRDNI